MRRSHKLIITATTLVALLLPAATVHAAPQAIEIFSLKLKDTACTHSGEFYGHGTVFTNAKATERRRNGSNYIVLRAMFQQRNGVVWETLTTYSYPSDTFPDDASAHALIQPFEWDTRPEDLGGVFRWRIQAQFWNKRPGPDIKIAQRVKRTDPCPT